MIAIRYSGDEIEIEGALADFKQLSHAIENLIEAEDKGKIVVACDYAVDPNPYPDFALELQIEIGVGLNYFRIENKRLMLSGDIDSLRNLAKNIPQKGHEKPRTIPYHIHYDALSSPVDPRSAEGIIFTVRPT